MPVVVTMLSVFLAVLVQAMPGHLAEEPKFRRA